MNRYQKDISRITKHQIKKHSKELEEYGMCITVRATKHYYRQILKECNSSEEWKVFKKAVYDYDSLSRNERCIYIDLFNRVMNKQQHKDK